MSINIIAGKLVGELAASYESLLTVQQQANIIVQSEQPILSITVPTPIAGDPGNVANSIAEELAAEMRESLNASFLEKLEAKLTATEAAFNAQVDLADIEREPIS